MHGHMNVKSYVTPTLSILFLLRTDEDLTDSCPILHIQPNSVKNYEHVFRYKYVHHSQSYGVRNHVPADGYTTAGA